MKTKNNPPYSPISLFPYFPYSPIRPRRLRITPLVRELVAETRLSKEMFIYPCFIVPGKGIKEPIKAMQGIYRFSADMLKKDIETGLSHGIKKVLLFGVGDEKSDEAATAFSEKSVVATALRLLKKSFGDNLYLITDVCACAYTTHGHCGIVENGYVVNDKSVEVLAKMALAHAAAGADMVAPSDMMDGRVGAIRKELDENGFVNTAIMSYSTKFASAYYGPFREAADSSPPPGGDRKSYQMDFRNGREAMREAALDEQEGADVLMVKPALAYLDIIRQLKSRTDLPVACYNVSGEYAMVKAAAAAGFVDERLIVMENMHAFVRSGADIIISYHIREMAEKGWI